MSSNVIIDGVQYVPVTEPVDPKGLTLGQYLEGLRNARGDSFQEAADGIGITKSQLWEIEKHSPDIYLFTAIKLARYYGITLNDIGACERKSK